MPEQWDEEAHAEQLSALLESAEDLMDDGKPKAAVRQLEAGLDLLTNKTTGAQGSVEHITTLHQLASVLAAQASTDPDAATRAQSTFEQVLDLTQAKAGKANRGYVATLRALADLAAVCKQPSVEIARLTEACSVLQEAGKVQGDTYINLSIALAKAQAANGNADTAVRLFERAADAMDAAGEREESGDRVMLFIAWGSALSKCSRHQEALELFERAEAIANRLLGRYNPMSAAALSAAAATRVLRVRAADPSSSPSQSSSSSQTPSNPSAAPAITPLSNDSGAGVGLDESDGEEQDVLAANGFQPTSDDPSSSPSSSSSDPSDPSNPTSTSPAIDPEAELRRAQTQYEAALSVHSVVSGEDSEEYGATAMALGDLCVTMGSHKRAASVFKDAAGATSGLTHVQAWNRAGHAYRHSGPFDEAGPCYASAMAALAELGADADGSMEQGEALLGSGAVAVWSQSSDATHDALDMLSRAREVFVKLGQTGSTWEGEALLASGVGLASLNKHEEAVAQFQDAAQCFASSASLEALNNYHWGLSLVALVHLDEARDRLSSAKSVFLSRSEPRAMELRKLASVLEQLEAETEPPGDVSPPAYHSLERQASWDESQDLAQSGAEPSSPTAEVADTLLDAEDVENGEQSKEEPGSAHQPDTEPAAPVDPDLHTPPSSAPPAQVFV